MSTKTIWNPGDIITQEKWDNINNNLSILGAYSLPVTIEEKEQEIMAINSTPLLKVGSTADNYNITIHKSYNEIVNLLKQGIICYFYNNLDGEITYITNYNNTNKTLNYNYFYEENGNMVNFSSNTYVNIT